MTEKDLKRLNRYQLLELLIAQTERADQLQVRVDELEQQLKERELKMDSMGSIAEASLQIGGVFQAVQAAAELYLDAARKQGEAIEESARKKAERILADAEAQKKISQIPVEFKEPTQPTWVPEKEQNQDVEEWTLPEFNHTNQAQQEPEKDQNQEMADWILPEFDHPNQAQQEPEKDQNQEMADWVLPEFDQPKQVQREPEMTDWVLPEFDPPKQADPFSEEPETKTMDWLLTGLEERKQADD